MKTATTKTRTLTAQQIRDHISAIRQLTKKDAQGRHQALLAKLEKGGHLDALKKGLAHGKWLPTLVKIKINERTAQQLMFIAASPLASQIRGATRISSVELPLDLGVLELLARLPAAALKKALRDWPFAEMTASEVAKKAREALGSKTKKSRMPKPQSVQADDTDPDADALGDDDAVDDVDDAAGSDDDYVDTDDDDVDDDDADTDAADGEGEGKSSADDADEWDEDDFPDEGDDPLSVIGNIAEQFTDDVVGAALKALESKNHDDEKLLEVTKALTACIRKLRRVQEAIDAAQEPANA